MTSILSTRADELGAGDVAHGRSAASWGAIIAGAVVAASVSIILLALGAGLGLATVSPWQGRGISATTFTAMTAIWFIVMQWVSACLGGYIAGRLRTRWVGTHAHEVFFRDTAHGLVTWALATVVLASVLAGSLSSLIDGGVQAVSAAPSSTSSAAGYNVDRLFRASGNSASGTADYRGEATHILAIAVTTGSLPTADRTYLAALVSQRTGVSQEDAQKRVDDAVASAMDVQTKAKEAAEAARKAAAEAAIYTALSMLIGAFIASVSAALGGRQRDEHL
jgi:hypothetical protein